MAQLVLRTLATLTAGIAVSAAAQTTPAFDPSGTEAGVPMAAPEAVPAPTTFEGSGGYQPLSPIPMEPITQHEALPIEGMYPAVTESSGTWLRRGLWYADLDAVILARTWDSNGATLIQEFDQIENQVLTSVNVINVPSVVNSQVASLGESSPGYDGSARLALGRFLFRDGSNRDHTAEMVVFGGAEWDERVSAEAQLTGDFQGVIRRNPNTGVIIDDQRGLHVPQEYDGSNVLSVDNIEGFTSFDRANTMDIEYASRFHSWEWNYSVAQRMRKDRMELQPSGEWVRRAAAGITWEWSAGLRYFDVEERLDWFATDVASVDTTDGDTDGAYDIDTSNNLFGLQFGAGITYDTDRWNVTVSTKQGFYVNDARMTEQLTYTDPDNDPTIALNNYSVDLHENGVSYLATGSVLARYHLRPNLSLRAGWEFMFVTGLALAPNQVNFNPATAQLHLTGDAFYHGVSFGSEYYW